MLTLTNITAHTVQIPSVYVTVATAQGERASKRLDISPLVVGTAPDCDIIIKDPCVSRRHCELNLTSTGIVIRDLGSKNGTFINDVQILEALLSLNAAAVLGKNTRLTLNDGGHPTILSLSQSVRFGEALGASVPMRALFDKLERVAASPETVLLLGESGTGKEILANAIHNASPRKRGRFVVFDCSAVAPGLLEAQLFGHERGAFTGADKAREGLLRSADGGTLFIDEIGELPLDLQPKLLRALESQTVRPVGSSSVERFDARVLAATHRDLRELVQEGKFRTDLYYRLAVVEMRIPPLRERKEDIPLLVERFLAARNPPRSISDLPPNAMDLLIAHSWPGNVRELRNTVARFVLFGIDAFEPSRDSRPSAESIPPLTPGHQALPGGPERTSELPSPPRPAIGFEELLTLPLREAREVVIEQFEKHYLMSKLREQSGNVTRASKTMGISRQFVHKLMERYGIRGIEG